MIKKKINSKVKGNTFEVRMMNWFKQIGYSFCKTSRNSSKLLDDCNVDLSFIPYAVQCKRGYEYNRPKPDIIFKNMEELLKINFPKEDPIHNYEKILIHSIKKGKEYGIVRLEFLMELLKLKHDQDSTNK